MYFLIFWLCIRLINGLNYFSRPHIDPASSKEKYHEIVEYLRSHPSTSSLIPAGAVPLRPISTNLFLSITNALLFELCGTSNAVNAKNYTEKVNIWFSRYFSH